MPQPSRQYEKDAARKRVAALALNQLDCMESLARKVMQKRKPGAVHHFRTASRRLEQALAVLFPRKPLHRLRKIEKRISQSRKALSAVRNQDVLIGKAEKAMESARGARRQTWEAILNCLIEQRERERSRAAAKLKKIRLPSMGEHLRAEIAQYQRREEGREDLFQKLGEAAQRAWADFDSARKNASYEAPDETVHPLRIAAKRLRYLLEIASELEAPQAAEALAALKILQDQLGEWHDCEVQGRILTKMAVRPGFMRKHLDLTADVLAIVAETRRSASRLLQDALPASRGARLKPVEQCVRRLQAARHKSSPLHERA